MNESYMKLFLPLVTVLLLISLKAEAGTLPTITDQKNSSDYYFVVTDDGQKAQSFIDNMGMTAIAFLSNKSLSQSQKENEFRNLLKDSFDMKTIGRFAMGRYWKGASVSQKKEYLKLFEKMIVEVYTARFNDYKGQKLDVISSRPDGSKDYLVNSNIVPNSGSKIKVDWRVRNTNGEYKIIDVIIEGVSMSLTQRSDFSSVIQRGGGNVEILLSHLRK